MYQVFYVLHVDSVTGITYSQSLNSIQVACACPTHMCHQC